MPKGQRSSLDRSLVDFVYGVHQSHHGVNHSVSGSAHPVVGVDQFQFGVNLFGGSHHVSVYTIIYMVHTILLMVCTK